MRGLRLDRISSVALVVAWAGLWSATLSSATWAGTEGSADHQDGPSLESQIPSPTPAEVNPPTSADVATQPPAAPDPKSPAASDVGPTAAQTPPVTKSPDGPSPAPPTSPPVAAGEPAQTPAIGAPSPPAAPPAAKDAAAPSAAPAAAGAPGPAPAPKDAKDNGKPIAANLAAADVPVAEKLRDLVTGRLDHTFEHKTDRQAVEAFYQGRGFAPLWIEGGIANARALGAIARLKAAAADGLDPTDYPTPDFSTAANHADMLAEDELKLTNAALGYARQAQTGRVHFSRVSGDIYYNLSPPDPKDVLSRLAQAKDAGEVLGSYNPPQEGFKQLRAKLAEIQGQVGAAAPPHIAAGPLLTIGMQDARVPLVRQRLHVAAEGGEATYDEALSEAVKSFQRQHDLKPTGNLNPATTEALNGPARDHEADILIANMERWRWLPRDLGKTYVMVNIADYTLKVVHNGAIVWRTKIVVGKPSTPTPLLSEPMKYITINPTWNVPPSIVQNEYLPALQQDPDALARIGLQVEYNRDGSLHIFQPPGEANALGRIRFNFPNKFLVYQHDTPDKNLFARDKRAYSHGCMRVQDPLKYAEVLLSYAAPNEGYTADRLRRMFGSDERDINFTNLVPVHITYQTAFIDESGKLERRPDVYGRDSRTLAVLRGEDRRLAEIPMERRETTRRPAIRVAPRSYPFPWQSPYRDSGLSFFERLFR